MVDSSGTRVGLEDNTDEGNAREENRNAGSDHPETSEDGHWRGCSIEISLCECRSDMVFTLFSAQEREKGGDILDTTGDGVSKG